MQLNISRAKLKIWDKSWSKYKGMPKLFYLHHIYVDAYQLTTGNMKICVFLA